MKFTFDRYGAKSLMESNMFLLKKTPELLRSTQFYILVFAFSNQSKRAPHRQSSQYFLVTLHYHENSECAYVKASFRSYGTLGEKLKPLHRSAERVSASNRPLND